jgi:recombinational DNA repair ATPase RecF
MSSEQLFLQAVTAYQTWVDCGKDFLNHTDLFEAWDDAVIAYAESINLKRSQAVTHVVIALKVIR